MTYRKKLARGAVATAIVCALTGAAAGSAVGAPTVDQGRRSYAPPCLPVPVWANTSPGRLIEYDPLTGAQLHNVPVPANLGDIAWSADGRTLYAVNFSSPARLSTIDPATGAVTATTPLTGPAQSVALNALTALPNGQLLAAAPSSRNLWTIDPATGTSTTFAAQFPSGFASTGDLTVLPDGDILGLANSGSPTGVFRIHPDNSVTEVGTLPSGMYGISQSGQMVYTFAGGGQIDRLSSVPTAASTAPLPFTVVASTGNSFYGASSVQDAEACSVPPGTSYGLTKTVAPVGKASPGDTLTYTVTVRNTGTNPYLDNSAAFTDDLSDVLRNASLIRSSVWASAGIVKVFGDTLAWNGPLPVGATVTVVYKVKVNDKARGRLANAVMPTAPGGTCKRVADCSTSVDISRRDHHGISIKIVNTSVNIAHASASTSTPHRPCPPAAKHHRPPNCPKRG
ncbi:SMP-30/gluconolactonase/LRE family protein [Streptacidiphilus melanogenes]|uniref:SMP-30/gluconolactonase/LRE family protein n=1 Tax=Streptacidiphilus melanogenes TaxID=411235 RepID=UPI0005AA48C3|nr:DUF11 domain-containing protein [Streptacidiphilus melanogenes]